ncbi:ABC transporter ATP-binding protein [Maritimibacter sp. DP1N21-5]|uniref:ABC transporter ATP-binding protein n=1 Tax=Maritimibacter sp. DP1N21-5 TaxID=2836867 RepID=UPI001C470094|nr:ABC transporter ATP-binding protein [Maritimibacter sp. DP1N21-5]MBV7408532.1 ABC transporter ATP-binding protein [Maritimibacter sp. DP1N21-5]
MSAMPSLENDPARAVAPGQPMISFRNIGLSFGTHEVLRAIDLDIAEGEFVSVVGPSGCGKTTLLRLLAGLVRPDRGEVLLNGQRLTGPDRKIAVVFQDYSKALLPWRTASGNIALALSAMGVPKTEWPERIEALLAMTGLEHAGDKLPRQMSGGMQQRLQIARCLAQEPTVLLMDEPFGALDAITRQTLQDEVLRIAAERKVTVFFVTHELEEAIYLGDRVVGLYANPGRVARSFDVTLAKPRDQLTTREDAQFLSLRHELFTFIKHA